MPRIWRIAGISFDHVHMPDLLRMVDGTPNAELVGIYDDQRERMEPISRELSIPDDRIFTDYRALHESTKPDLVILCAATAKHGDWAERIAPYGAHLFVEKPFAASLAEADRIVDAMEATGCELAVNWPQRWNAPYVTAKRLIDEGLIGEVTEVHYFGGNEGPVHMVTNTEGMSEDELLEAKRASWFYQAETGGGSLLDYLGYGTTLGTWFMGGRKPIDVVCMVDEPEGLEVDEQSVTVCRYASGLSTFGTRWGTLTNHWDTHSQPKVGYVVVGRDGSVSAYGGEAVVRAQTRERSEIHEIAVTPLEYPERNPIEYVLHCLETGAPIDGPLSPEIARIGQQIVDSALLSARGRRTVPLAE